MLESHAAPSLSWRQLHNETQDKAEEQRRRSESLQHELEEMSKEKAAVEAHADLLEKALMKLSVDNSKPQPQARLPAFNLQNLCSTAFAISSHTRRSATTRINLKSADAGTVLLQLRYL